MNDAWGYEDNDNAGQDNNNLDGPKALREAYAALKKQNEETTAMVRELLNEKKTSQLAAVFDTLGVPGAASVYQGDADPEKAKAWVESMRGVFGGNTQGSTPPVADQTPALDAQTQQQFERMTEAGQSGTPMGNAEAAHAAVGNAQNIEDLIAAFQRGATG